MWDEEVKSRAIKTPICEGRIASQFERVVFGGIFGVMFSADIEFTTGKTHVEFVVHDCDLIQREWEREHPRQAKAWLN